MCKNVEAIDVKVTTTWWRNEIIKALIIRKVEQTKEQCNFDLHVL
jgi:hypothetical protein